MNYNVNDIKTNIVAGYNYCMKVYNGGIKTPEQFETFINLCEAHINNCNFYCMKLKPCLGIFNFKRYRDYMSVRNVCADTVDTINDVVNGLNVFMQKQKEENEAYAQLEKRLRFEAAVAYSIKENECKQTLEDTHKHSVGFIINKNNDDKNE